MPKVQKIQCVSMGRYNGGVKAKRLHGSSTITRFMVWIDGDALLRKEYEVGGATPSARKAEAIRRFKAEVLREVHES